MNAASSLLLALAVAAVSALPVTFNSHLLKEGDSALAVLTHASHEVGENALRFLHLVPKLTTYMKDGFESQDLEAGNSPVHHDFLDIEHSGGEKFVSLVGFSDCASWHAGVVTVKFPSGDLVHKGFTAVLEDDDFKLTRHSGSDVLAKVAAFVHGKTTLELFQGVVRDGLASHHLSHLLYAKFKKDLEATDL